MDIEWILKNYTEDKLDCEKLLFQASVDYSFTQEQFIDGCKELKRYTLEKVSLKQHLKILGEMSLIGIKSSIAGKKIREAIIESWHQ